MTPDDEHLTNLEEEINCCNLCRPLTSPQINGGESEPSNLQAVIVRMTDAVDNSSGERVSVAEVLGALGSRSFGPLLLVPALIALSPIGAIPGLPGIMAIVEILIAGQMLVGFDHFWIPRGVANRSVSGARFQQTLRAITPYAICVDRLVMPRLSMLTRGPFFYLIALVCLALAVIMPIIELVPLAGIVPNAALTAFGLALTAHDGVLAIIAFLFTALSIYFLVSIAI